MSELPALPERFVYVDDEQDMRQLLRDVTEDAGYEGAFAACGSGKELLSRLPVLQPQLILMDLIMPDMDGPDLMEQLKRDPQFDEVPVIFVTGIDRFAMNDQYELLDVIGVIRKPFNTDTILNEISKLWSEYLSTQKTD